MNNYQRFIALSRYARYIPEQGRRETWEETVQRLCDFWADKYKEFPKEELQKAITNLEVMPSMRSLMTAGPALDRDNVAGFNCSFIAVDDPKAFDEAMYILMCGTGLGFSVESKHVNKMPEVAEVFYESPSIVVVQDSRIGWASAYRQLISMLYQGLVPSWDTSRVRPAGAPLKTFGGRASGPKPLEDLFSFTVNVFKGAAGRKLTSLECHDLVCKVADIVVVGGVRRSALISLSDLGDDDLRHAKDGEFWVTNRQRALANNSAVYPANKPKVDVFLREWIALYASRSGERGIFNNTAVKDKVLENGRRDANHDFGTNPCGEIILRSAGLCNLSEVVIRPTDTVDTLKRKVVLATILGTFQSTLTKFRYLRKIWQKNAEEERLLGVSLTGIYDHPQLRETSEETAKILQELKNVAIETNKQWAAKIGVNPSVAITTVKPSGTVSQLVDSASGIHPRYSEYYIRNVRNDKKDPLSDFLIASGVPYEEDEYNPSAWVFSFPTAAPGSVTSKDVSALQQLEHYKMFRENWCEHNPSITVYVRENEWIEVGAWVHKNFDSIGGVSFLPYSDHVYPQAPYIPISAERYAELQKTMPQIDWGMFKENADNVTGYREFACVGNSCEL